MLARELKMQSEELVDTQIERQCVLERYTCLYDFAPVGYFDYDQTNRQRRGDWSCNRA